MAIAPTLQKLVVSSCGLDDDALEPFVVLQGLTALDARANRLASLGRLQQLLLRLPVLQTLAIEGNGALCDAPKLRERLIVASASLATLDARPIKDERAFMTLAMRQQQQQLASASASCTAAATARRRARRRRRRRRRSACRRTAGGHSSSVSPSPPRRASTSARAPASSVARRPRDSWSS